MKQFVRRIHTISIAFHAQLFNTPRYHRNAGTDLAGKARSDYRNGNSPWRLFYYERPILTLLDYCDALEAGTPLDPRDPKHRFVGIDIEIRAQNQAAIENHPMASRIDMIEGSSKAEAVIEQVHSLSSDFRKIFICLDSNHTHNHVLAKLEAYAPLTNKGSYCCVFDTLVEDLSSMAFDERPWGVGNNPKTAVQEFMKRLKTDGHTATDGSPLHLEIDKALQNKLLVKAVPDGYLKRA